MSVSRDNEERYALPEGSIVAKLDNVLALQDYLPEQPCVRLLGVSEADFETSAFNERRAEIFLVDLGLGDIRRLRRLSHRRNYYMYHWMYHWDVEDWNEEDALADVLGDAYDDHNLDSTLELNAPDTWIRVRYQHSSKRTTSYGYCLFREQGTPTYLRILAIEVFQSPQVVALPPQQPLTLPPPQSGPGGPLLQAFQVGQGMCSLIVQDGLGILMDCGAGTPIKRPDYWAGTVHNDLAPLVAGLPSLIAVVSHADSDHWRLLDWDAALRAKVGMIAIPSGIGMLAFTSPGLPGLVVGIGDCSLPLGAGVHLDLLRTQPKHSDTNGRGLVAHLYTDEVSALLPGDYVYARFATDTNPGINALLGKTFDALVVPHHGCGASADQVPAARVPGRSQAFVSAGDHTYYRHPRFDSLWAHSAQDFRIVNDKTARHVWSHTLLD